MKKLFIMMAFCVWLNGCGGQPAETRDLETTKAENRKETATEIAESVPETKEEKETEAEFIDEFEKADFDKFNSYASENGLEGTLIYIDGVAVEKKNDKEFFAFIIEESPDHKWVAIVSDTDEEDCGISLELLDRKVRFFGEYLGYSDVYDMPAMTVFCEEGKIQRKEDLGKYKTAWKFDEYVGRRISREEANASEQQKEEDHEKPFLNGTVEVVAEYTLPDGIGWYTRHFMILENKSGETVDVSTSSLAYGSDGSMISAANSDLDALGAGCTSIVCEAFETGDHIDRYDTEVSASASQYYESVIEDLSFTQNNISGGAVFQITNNGEEPAEFVKGYALFFSGDELVAYENTYFTDDDSEIKPGKTISRQMTCRKEFDRIEFYMTGRRYE